MEKWRDKMLPQELFAEAAWLENQHSYLTDNKIKELLQKNNLKLRKGKTIDDIHLAIGRGFKDTFGNSSLAREKIAEEIDKVCVIARWDFAVSKYKGQ